jgi:hypothetical protein
MKTSPTNYDDVLEKRSFETLSIIRASEECFLLIALDGDSHVYSDKKGKKKQYRHAWQIKQWLQSRFGIDPATIEVKEIKYED